jgi:hypothetical protein
MDMPSESQLNTFIDGYSCANYNWPAKSLFRIYFYVISVIHILYIGIIVINPNLGSISV